MIVALFACTSRNSRKPPQFHQNLFLFMGLLDSIFLNRLPASSASLHQIWFILCISMGEGISKEMGNDRPLIFFLYPYYAHKTLSHTITESVKNCILILDMHVLLSHPDQIMSFPLPDPSSWNLRNNGSQPITYSILDLLPNVLKKLLFNDA